jgi:hypothetical protein
MHPLTGGSDKGKGWSSKKSLSFPGWVIPASWMRLDQDRHHPKLEVPRLTCLGRESKPGLRGGRRALQQKAFFLS